MIHPARNEKSCILVCVTVQKECDRLIHWGKKQADETGLPLHVLHISSDKNLLSVPGAGDILNKLFSLAHEANAEMNILYDPDAPAAIARYVMEQHAQMLIMGPDKSGFSRRLSQLLPEGTQFLHLEE